MKAVATNYEERFYDLGQFLGCSFHQDWKDDYDWQGETPNFEAVVRFFKANNPPAYITKATEELRQFLALPLGDEEFEEVVNHEFMAWYIPRSRGLSKRQWLEEVLKILEEPATQPSQLRFVG